MYVVVEAGAGGAVVLNVDVSFEKRGLRIGNGGVRASLASSARWEISAVTEPKLKDRGACLFGRTSRSEMGLA